MYENYEDQQWEQPGGPYWTEPVKPKKSGMGKVVALTLVCSLLSGALGAGAVLFWNRNEVKAPETTHILESNRTQVQLEQVESGEEMTPAQVYAQNVNSTVGITTSITTNYWGYQTTSAASGSGFILTEDGYILTNYHVIEGSDSISVSCYDGTTYDATLIGYDAGNDIAVLKVAAENLTPVVLGDSDTLYVGDPVVAIGNPLGELTFSLTSGTVSATGRMITMSNGSTMNLIQTDCAINSGNSGGALFSLYGEVIGITNAKYSSSSSSEASIDNIGFAIPINDVKKIVASMIENGYYAKPYIGISVSDVSAETQSYGLPQGAAVRTVEEGSPAEEAGLQSGDIITHLGGKEVTGSSQLIAMVSDVEPEDQLTLRVYRSGQTLELTVTVGKQIQDTTPSRQNTHR